MKKAILLTVALCACLLAPAAALAQVDATKGSIGGTVVDTNGAALPGAKVSVSGPLGERTVNANDEGVFVVNGLTPGAYAVRVEQAGFKTASVEAVVVNVGKESSLTIKLEAGAVSEVVTVTDAAATDLSTTAVGQNLNDQLFENIPVQRSVSSLFYLSPGASDGLGGGRDNPSISGGSALDNLYVADGVNITDSAFGGIGTFSRSYGALGTGINTSFIKEVQVKTAGFEPQYGQSQGGIINIITQSGSNEYHGALYGYAQPRFFEAGRRQPDEPDRVNKFGKILNEEGYDVGADLGGYVPGARNNLFFYGSFNPTVNRDIVRGAEANVADPTDSGLRTLRGERFHLRTRSYNYAGKVDWAINSNHQLTFSIFGDPSKTNRSSFRTLVIDNTTADSQLAYGTRNMSVRYNGALSPTVSINASFGLGRSSFEETDFDNLNLIADRRGSDAATILTAAGITDTSITPARGNFTAAGLGFYEPTLSRSRRAEVNLSKIQNFWGQHTFGVGYTFQRGFYEGQRERSGPRYAIPSTNADGTYTTPAVAAGQQANVQFRLRFRGAGCTLCPLLPVQLSNGSTVEVPVALQFFRAEFGDPFFDTYSNYHAGYVQDTWRINKYVTALLGLRHEQERLVGNPGSTGERVAYSFTGQWAPRLGVTVDPFGRGRSKAFYNYGRFFEYIPLDLAERSLSAEKDFTGAFFAPQFTVGSDGRRRAVVNQFGTVTPVINAASFLNNAAGGTGGDPTISAADPTNPIVPGTKLGFTDEHTFGFEQQLPKNFVLSVRYVDRRIKRIVEDAASVSPEAALAGIGQIYYIGNINSRLDAATNLQPFVYATGGAAPAGCARDGGDLLFNFDGPGNQSVCFSTRGTDADHNAINNPDGQADGFPDPQRIYRAVEIEVNKRFSNNWQLFTNWRIASLRGNYEGHLRNDNGQTDPAISSLFDFTTGDLNLLGDQFAVGALNTDRRHIANVYGSYTFTRDGGFGRALAGLNLGVNMHVESGIPISEYLAHPVYLNAGEIPVGGRGSLGRTPAYTRFDAHADYSLRTSETSRVKFVADFFNVFNSQRVRFPTQFRELDLAAPNPDFLKPAAFYLPFNMRLGIRYEF